MVYEGNFSAKDIGVLVSSDALAIPLDTSLAT